MGGVGGVDSVGGVSSVGQKKKMAWEVWAHNILAWVEILAWINFSVGKSGEFKCLVI